MKNSLQKSNIASEHSKYQHSQINGTFKRSGVKDLFDLNEKKLNLSKLFERQI